METKYAIDGADGFVKKRKEVLNEFIKFVSKILLKISLWLDSIFDISFCQDLRQYILVC